MDRLDVQTRRLQPVLTAILGLILIPLAVLSLFTGLSSGVSMMPVMMGVLMLATFGRSAWLLPTRIGNRRQVDGFVRALPCEHAEVDV